MKQAGSDFIEHTLIQKYQSESCNAHCSSIFMYIEDMNIQVMYRCSLLSNIK